MGGSAFHHFCSALTGQLAELVLYISTATFAKHCLALPISPALALITSHASRLFYVCCSLVWYLRQYSPLCLTKVHAWTNTWPLGPLSLELPVAPVLLIEAIADKKKLPVFCGGLFCPWPIPGQFGARPLPFPAPVL